MKIRWEFLVSSNFFPLPFRQSKATGGIHLWLRVLSNLVEISHYFISAKYYKEKLKKKLVIFVSTANVQLWEAASEKFVWVVSHYNCQNYIGSNSYFVQLYQIIMFIFICYLFIYFSSICLCFVHLLLAKKTLTTFPSRDQFSIPRISCDVT